MNKTLFHKPSSRPERTTGFGLPPDLLDKARTRVRLVGIIGLIGFGTDPLLSIAEWLVDGQPSVHPGRADLVPLIGTVVGAALALALILATRSPRIRNTTVLNLGLVFEVVVCLIISVSNPLSQYRQTGVFPNMTWVTPVIILFPLIIPCPPRRMLLTSGLAALTVPLGLFILRTIGGVPVTPAIFVSCSHSPIFATVFAYLASRVIYGLTQEIAAARRMGSYVLSEKLGSGGMGEVWRAEHTLLARPAAVKLIRPDLLGGTNPDDITQARQRFEREAQATAAMRSPHTIEVFDFGFSEGTCYYVMELLEGIDLDKLVREFGPLPAERVVHVLKQVCDSLGEAHEQGLIHRDIKPANIHVCRYGRKLDFVKVLDFGLVKHRSRSRDTSEGLTGLNTAPGTPAFMSPEQILADRPLDGSADLYALGCVAYWLLTGTPVFGGSGVMEVLTQHLRDVPTPPSQRTELPIPPGLDDVVLACLEKDPARRPQSADALLARLDACGVGPWPVEAARAWWDRHRPEAHPSPAAVEETTQAVQRTS